MHLYASPSRCCWLCSKGGTGALFIRDALGDWKDRVSPVIDRILSERENIATPCRSF